MINSQPLVAMSQRHEDMIESLRNDVEYLRKQVKELERIVMGDSPMEALPHQAYFDTRSNHG